MLVDGFRNPEIEPRIVDQDHDIRTEPEDVFHTETDASQIRSGMEDDLRKTHDGTFLIVFHESVAGLMQPIDIVHQGTTPEADIRRRIFGIQSFHQVGTMEVSGSFPGYDIIFHDWKS